MDKDYYKIMGVNSDASEKDIKMAYRKLARKYHPDVSKEANAEEHFKEVGAAYEVLKDPAKRAEYDNYLKNKDFQQQTQDRHWQPEEDQPFYNGSINEDLFESLFGHSRHRQQAMAGQDYYGKINLSLEEAFSGTVKNIQLPASHNSPATPLSLKVKIPAGIKAEQQIRLAGQGAPGINGGPHGDVYLSVSIEKHPLFELIDNDVYLTLPITPWEAALGATLAVPTLGGKIDLKIPPGSQGGQKLRLKNRGLPGTPPGHQYVLLKISTPPANTEAATALYKKMAEVMPFNPRTNMGV